MKSSIHENIWKIHFTHWTHNRVYVHNITFNSMRIQYVLLTTGNSGIGNEWGQRKRECNASTFYSYMICATAGAVYYMCVHTEFIGRSLWVWRATTNKTKKKITFLYVCVYCIRMVYWMSAIAEIPYALEATANRWQTLRKHNSSKDTRTHTKHTLNSQ